MTWKQHFRRILSPSETEGKIPASTFQPGQIERKAGENSVDGEPTRGNMSKSNIQRVSSLPRQLGKCH